MPVETPPVPITSDERVRMILQQLGHGIPPDNNNNSNINISNNINSIDNSINNNNNNEIREVSTTPTEMIDRINIAQPPQPYYEDTSNAIFFGSHKDQDCTDEGSGTDGNGFIPTKDNNTNTTNDNNNNNNTNNRDNGKDVVTSVPTTPNETQSSTNLFISNFPHKYDHTDLEKMFAPYGEILSAAVMRNIHTGKSRGTAFVRFATTEQARTAIAEMNGRSLFGRTISVHWAKKQHDDTPVGEARKKIFKLFVRNIPLDITVDDLTTLFQQYGPVKDVTLHKDTAAVADRRLERRIAFVAYLVEGAAERAAECVHNTQPFHSCCRIPLMVKLAEDHQQKRGSASNTHNANNNTNTTTDVPSPTATAEMKSADQHSSTSSNNVTNSSRSSSSYNTNTEDSRRNFFPGTAACVQESRSNLLLPASLIASVLSRAHYSAGSSSSSSDRNMYRNGEAHAGRRRYMHNPYSAFHSRVYIVAS